MTGMARRQPNPRICDSSCRARSTPPRYRTEAAVCVVCNAACACGLWPNAKRQTGAHESGVWGVYAGFECDSRFSISFTSPPRGDIQGRRLSWCVVREAPQSPIEEAPGAGSVFFFLPSAVFFRMEPRFPEFLPPMAHGTSVAYRGFLALPEQYGPSD